MIVKQNASLDASFWINICAAGLVQYLREYFILFVNRIVASEIRYPLEVIGIASQTTTIFNDWVSSGDIRVQDPIKLVNWFQQGENAAIALAMEIDSFVLMDDANPYHRAKAAGLKVIGSAEFIILLYDHGHISGETAVSAIQNTQASKKQKRQGLMVLERLKRDKEG